MIVSFTEIGWEDYLWFQQNDKRVLKKLNSLIKEIKRTPFEGSGKPEMLRANLSGYWSRRVTHEHRLVYSVDSNSISIISCRFHYSK